MPHREMGKKAKNRLIGLYVAPSENPTAIRQVRNSSCTSSNVTPGGAVRKGLADGPVYL